MSIQTAVSTTVPAMPPALKAEIQTMLPTIGRLLPVDMPMEKFRAATWLHFRQMPVLLTDCWPDTVLECLVKSATYGLMPWRDCHFVPFKNKKRPGKKVATFVANYQGIQRVLDRTGKVAKSFAHPVYWRDVYEIDYLADIFSHRPASGDRGQLRCFYGCIIMKDGTKHVQEMSLADIEAIKRRSPAHDDGPWQTDFVAMARKTALKQTAKYCNLSETVTTLLGDDDAREHTDIPQARITEHTGDMFGDQAESPAQQLAKDAVTPEAQAQAERQKLLSDIMHAREEFHIPTGAFHTWLEKSETAMPQGLMQGLGKADVVVIRAVFDHLCLYENKSCTVLLGEQPVLPGETVNTETGEMTEDQAFLQGFGATEAQERSEARH